VAKTTDGNDGNKVSKPMIGTQFSRSACLMTLAIGIISGMVPALQSSLLPQLVVEGRLTLAGLGQVAMAEAAGTLVAIVMANATLKPERLRLIVIVAAVAGLLLDLATARLFGTQIALARFAHGLCAGVLVWVWIGLLTRIENPARLMALYITIQAGLLLALSTFFATTLLAWGGAMAGFGALALLYGLMVILAFGVPPRFEPLIEEGGSIWPDTAGWVGLTVVFLQLAAILALWVYIKPLGQQFGLSDAEAGLTISIALGSQIFAGIAAAAVAGRARAPLVLFLVAIISAAATVVLGITGSSMVFTLGTVIFAFLWMFAPPFQMPYLIELDPSRRAAMHMATAQLLGIAAGPALASLAVSRSNVRGALLSSGVLYLMSALIIAATAMRPAARKQSL
jgi:MFS transporter, DHA1 family, inner membrane transport protein